MCVVRGCPDVPMEMGTRGVRAEHQGRGLGWQPQGGSHVPEQGAGGVGGGDPGLQAQKGCGVGDLGPGEHALGVQLCGLPLRPVP